MKDVIKKTLNSILDHKEYDREKQIELLMKLQDLIAHSYLDKLAQYFDPDNTLTIPEIADVINDEYEALIKTLFQQQLHASITKYIQECIMNDELLKERYSDPFTLKMLLSDTFDAILASLQKEEP